MSRAHDVRFTGIVRRERVHAVYLAAVDEQTRAAVAIADAVAWEAGANSAEVERYEAACITVAALGAFKDAVAKAVAS